MTRTRQDQPRPPMIWSRRRRAAAVVGLALAHMVGVWSGPARAENLEEALALAYTTNPQLDAQRAALRSADERVSQAVAGYHPQVTARGSVGVNRSITETSNGVGSTSDPNGTTRATTQSKSAGVDLNQPLYQGGRISAGIEAAENRVRSQRALLSAAEQEVLKQAVTVYMDVVRDQAVLRLTTSNEQVLRRQLEAAQDRFRVGEITRTDVSQAESRLARATADRVSAEGRLQSSRSAYLRVVGKTPGELKAPRVSYKLPASSDETVTQARTSNPSVIAATYDEKAARSDIETSNSARLPNLSLKAGVGRDWNDYTSYSLSPSSRTRPGDTERDNAYVRAEVSVPLYTGGANEARVREAKQEASRRQVLIEQSRRQATDEAVRSWQQLVTSRASIQSRRSQVRASEIALEGVRQEATVGSRTVLDTLDAEQELLDARVQLVSAERDEVVAAFTVLSAIGQLTARQLGLPVEHYDQEKYYQQNRGRVFGTRID